MQNLPDFLIKNFSFSLSGKERYCLLSEKTVNGYLSVGNIIPHIPDVTKFLICRDLKTKLEPASLSLNSFTKKVTLEKLFLETKDYAILTQEQITATISAFEKTVLPTSLGSVHGISNSVFFFEESKRVYVSLFKTSSEGNECEVHEMNDVVKTTILGARQDRIILRDK